MDVKQLEQDVREGRVKLDRLVELLVTQQRKLAEAQERIRTLEATVEELQKQLGASAAAKFAEPFSLKAEEKRQEARGRKAKKKKNKPRRRGRLSTAEKLALAEQQRVRVSGRRLNSRWNLQTTPNTAGWPMASWTFTARRAGCNVTVG